MDWEKPSKELGDILAAAAGSMPLVEQKKMFGALALFLNGNMLAGVHGSKIVVRLSEKDRAAAIAESGALPFEPMPGRLMKEYVVVPKAVVEDENGLLEWLERAIEFVGSLPPKEAKAPRNRRAT